MAIMCRVEQSEANGKLRGLRIVHPDMGVVMNWGRLSSAPVVRYVSQQTAFQMMADIERSKTHLMERQCADRWRKAAAG